MPAELPRHLLVQRRLAIVSRAALLLVVAAAVLVFIGWTFNIELLKSLLHPARVGMNPATALSFLLLAGSLWLQRDPSPRSPTAWIARAMAAMVVMIAIARMLSYLGIVETGIDQILFRSRLAGNIMAINAALALLLMGLAMLLLDVEWGTIRFHIAQVCTLAAFGIALFSLTGYLYGAVSLYGMHGFTPMALNTSICFGLLCIAELCARPYRQPMLLALSPTFGGSVARRLLPAAFIVPMLLGWFIIQGQRRGLNPTIGVSLLVLLTIAIFNLMIWWCARVLQLNDLRHRRAEAEIRQSEERHRAIMQQSADGIYLVDLEDKRILDANPAFNRLLGYSPEDTPTLKVYDLVRDSRDHVDQRLQALIDTHESLHGEREYCRKDGSIVEVASSASVIAYDGRQVACTVVHDITARKKAARELEEKHRQLQQALEQLQQAQSQLVQSEKLASLGQMVAGVAHEINNPLSFVSNNVAVLQRDSASLVDLLRLYEQAAGIIAERNPELARQIADLGEEIDLAYTVDNLKELTSRSRDGLKRIQQIVKDLRDFARLDESDIHNADINAGIDSTLNIIAGVAKKKDVHIDKELGDIPQIVCNPAKINQVVMNLLSNAIDACPGGCRVKISTRATETAVLIEVSDTGPGIPPEIRERIFDPFFTTKPPGAGTGLGLSISYGIVHDHGGKIEVSSTVGQGTTFTVTLPLTRAASAT